MLLRLAGEIRPQLSTIARSSRAQGVGMSIKSLAPFFSDLADRWFDGGPRFVDIATAIGGGGPAYVQAPSSETADAPAGAALIDPVVPTPMTAISLASG